jgi:hypothetical protein
VNKSGSRDASPTPSQQPTTASAAHWVVPLLVAVVAWLAVASVPLPYVVKQTITVIVAAVVFGCVNAYTMPKLDPLMSTVSRRAKRRSEVVMVKLCVSAFVCSVVLGLIAFHDVLYTTQLANATPWRSSSAVVGEVPVAVVEHHQHTDQHEQEVSESVSKHETPSLLVDEIHFCGHWVEDEDNCSSSLGHTESVGNTESVSDTETVKAANVELPLPSSGGKYFMRSPMHFVAAVLAWASLSRFTMKLTVLNALHAGSLITLSVLSYATDTKTATTALGLLIVHGVSELHACFRYSRTLFKLRGYTLGHQWYAYLWQLDVLAMLVIRWLPVPILLSPVILKAPLRVLLPICCIAFRETVLLFETMVELKQEMDNKANTDALLVQARSQDELIKTMAGGDGNAKSVVAAPAVDSTTCAPQTDGETEKRT